MAYFKVRFLLQEGCMPTAGTQKAKMDCTWDSFCVLEKQCDCSQCTWAQCDSHGGKQRCSPLLLTWVELTHYKMIHEHVPIPRDFWAARPSQKSYNWAQSTLWIGLVLWIPAVERHRHMAPLSLGKLSDTSGLMGLCCFGMGIFLVKIVSDYKRQQTVMVIYLKEV